MQLRYMGLVGLILLVLGTVALFVQPVYACSPMPTPDGPTPTAVTLESRVQGTQIIFEGTVTAISEDRALTTVQVSRYFKGNGPGSVTVLGFGWGTDCLPTTYVGEHAIFYTFGDPAEELSIPSSGNVEAVSDKTVAAIIKAVGHDPAPAPNDPMQVIVMALVGLGTIIVILAALVWLRRKLKST